MYLSTEHSAVAVLLSTV